MSRPLVIVESPAKARTLARLLGDEYRVEASVGHVRDLPENASEVPAEIKDKPWGSMGVDVDNGFRPYYVIARDKAGRIRDLRAAVKDAPEVLLATDPDREGESISWHLREVLKPKVPVRRIEFHEITEEAVRTAIDEARDIDLKLVDAQESRRIVDRLYGYMVSPVLWKKVQTGLSAGRVQSVAVRLIVEREEERGAFRKSAYWDLEARLSSAGTLVHGHAAAGRSRAARDRQGLRPGHGQAEGHERAAARRGSRRRAARRLTERLPWSVTLGRGTAGHAAPVRAVHDLHAAAGGQPEAGVLGRPHDERRPAPLPGRHHLVPPHRLDLAERARAGRGRGRDPRRCTGPTSTAAPRQYRTKVKNAQEAHEAIRPTDFGQTPNELRQRVGATSSACTT